MLLRKLKNISFFSRFYLLGLLFLLNACADLKKAVIHDYPKQMSFVYDNKVVVMHNLWGIKISGDGKDGRIIVGKTVFSTLEIGKEQKFYNGSLLSKLDSMNILTLKP